MAGKVLPAAKKPFYYTDTSVLLQNTPLLKFIRNHIRDSGGVFSISSPVKISMISLIFGNFRKMFGNVRVTFVQVLENLRKSSKSGRKS